VLPLDPHSDLSAIIRIVIGGVVLLAVVIWQTLAVMHSTHARARAIEALAACAVVVVVVFASAYINMSARDPQAFSELLNRTRALYFTVVTLATIGYGDITPRTDVARIVVMFQVVVNIAILGSAVRVISGLARRRPLPSEAGPD
jgi:voltage-gated potassium channel